MPRLRRAVIVIGALALVSLVAVGLPFYATETEAGTDKCHLGSPELSETFVEGWSWWPIGTRCALVTRDGRRFDEVVPPWRDNAWLDEAF